MIRSTARDRATVSVVDLVSVVVVIRFPFSFPCGSGFSPTGIQQG
jgi:hypothetical protein